MFYPTGKNTNGRKLVCMCCEDVIPNPVTNSVPYQIAGEYASNEDNQYDSPGNLYNSQYPMYESAHDMEKAIRKRLDEKNWCVKSKQLERAISEAGFSDYCLQEMEGGAAPMASLATTSGMGAVTPPTFPGTTQADSSGGLSPNAGFYSQSWQGSGDRFDAVGIKRKKKTSKESKPKESRKFKKVQDFKTFLLKSKK